MKTKIKLFALLIIITSSILIFFKKDSKVTPLQLSTQDNIKIQNSESVEDKTISNTRIAKKIIYTAPKIGDTVKHSVHNNNEVSGKVIDFKQTVNSDGTISRITVMEIEEMKYSKIRLEKKYKLDAEQNEVLVGSSTMVADHILVEKSAEIDEEQLKNIAESKGLKIRKKMYSKNMYILETPQVKVDSVQNALASLDGIPEIKLSDPDYIVYHCATPNDSSFNELWGMHNTGQTRGKNDADIDAPEAWNVFSGSRSVVVGVIDTGIDYNHPDLKANMWTNPNEIPANGIDDDGNGLVDDVHGYDFYEDDGDPSDSGSHGTHCAGTIGAVGDNKTGVAGVNWKVKMVALKFIGPAPFGGTDSDATDSINYATDIGVDLTSNSWGGTGRSKIIQAAIQRANSKNILFVAAAGNSNVNSDVTPLYPAAYEHENVVSVAATDHNDERSSFSNYSATKVDLGAPGTKIYSTIPGGKYGNKSGTSMATPHVAGACALIKGYAPTLTSEEIKYLVMNTGDRTESMEGATVSGKRLNLFNALKFAKTSSIFINKNNTYSRFVRGKTAVISWESLRVKGNVRIELTSNKLRGFVISGNTPNTGSYRWNVPNNLALGEYQLKVSSLNNRSVSDAIDTEITVENFPQSLVGWKQSPKTSGTFTVTDSNASEGLLSLRNEQIGTFGRAAIEFTGEFQAGNISFDAMIRSDYNDQLVFYIDGKLRKSFTPHNKGWTNVSFPLPAGTHTFKWVFENNYHINVLDNASWIDNVKLPKLKSSNTPPKIVAGAKASPSTVKLTESTSLSVKASDADNDRLTYKWQKVSGPGNVSFTSSNSDNASAKFSKAGQYRIKVIISDSKETVESFVNVTVKDTTVVAEKGSFLITQESRNQWHSVKLNKQYKSPVIIFSPVTYNGAQPAHIRVKNIKSDSFEWQIEEWDYLDGYHLAEKVDYIILEAGTYKLEDGRSLVAGNVVSQDSLTSHSMPKVFKINPIVVTQLVSAQDKRPATVRLNNIRLTSFDIKLQSEEAYNKEHGDEIVSYIAVEPGQYEDAGLLEAEVTGFDVGSNWFELQFSQTYEQKPSLFASFQTSRGNNTVDLRIRNLDNGSVDAIAQEEQSKDEEVFHLKEKLGYILFNLDQIKK